MNSIPRILQTEKSALTNTSTTLCASGSRRWNKTAPLGLEGQWTADWNGNCTAESVNTSATRWLNATLHLWRVPCPSASVKIKKIQFYCLITSTREDFHVSCHFFLISIVGSNE